MDQSVANQDPKGYTDRSGRAPGQSQDPAHVDDGGHRLVGRGHEAEPLSRYAVLMTGFTTLAAGTLGVLRWTGHEPKRIAFGDFVLMGLATNRLSRLITRDKVTRVIRAPFTEVDEDARPEQIKERARGQGMTRAIGELVTCPRCTAMWAAAGLTLAYAYSRPLTRFVSGFLALAAVSDYVNTRFGRLREQLAEEIRASMREQGSAA